MSDVSEVISRYLATRSSGTRLRPKVKLDGRLYEWEWPFIFVTDIAGLSYCTYNRGLRAKLSEEEEELPPFPEETQEDLNRGKVGHERLGETLDVPPWADFTDRDKPVTHKALKRLLTSKEEVSAIEFPIILIHNGLMIRGRIDHIQFKKGTPTLVEEWKFPNNGRVSPYHKDQVELYAYMLHKWLGVYNIPSRVKVWKESKWDKDSQIQAVEGFVPEPAPTGVYNYLLKETNMERAERLLSRAYSFFTGNEECVPDPNPASCKRCRTADKCSHRDNDILRRAKLIDISYENQEATLSFER